MRFGVLIHCHAIRVRMSYDELSLLTDVPQVPKHKATHMVAATQFPSTSFLSLTSSPTKTSPYKAQMFWLNITGSPLNQANLPLPSTIPPTLFRVPSARVKGGRGEAGTILA